LYYPSDISPKRHGRISFPIWEVLATLCIASVGGVLLFNFFWVTAALFSLLLCLTLRFCSFNTDENEEEGPDSEKRTAALAPSVFFELHYMFPYYLLYSSQWFLLWYLMCWDGQDWCIFGRVVPPIYTILTMGFLYVFYSLDNWYQGELRKEIPAWKGAIGSGLSLVVIYGFGILGYECPVINMYLLTGLIFFYFCHYSYEDDPSVIKDWVSSAEILMGSILVFSYLVFLAVLSPFWAQEGWVFTIVTGLCLYAGYQEYEDFGSVPFWVCPLATGVPLFEIGYVVHVLKDLSGFWLYVILSIFFFVAVEVYYLNVIRGNVPAWVVSSLSGVFFGGVTFCAFYFEIGKSPVTGIYVLPGLFFLYSFYYGYVDEFREVLTSWVSGLKALPDSKGQDTDRNPKSININTKEQEKQSLHVVDASPWPFLVSQALASVAVSFAMRVHGIGVCPVIHIYVLPTVILFYFLYRWFQDIITESVYQGHHTWRVVQGLKLGTLLFILSEAMLFFCFFLAYFYYSQSPSIWIGAVWPPKGIMPIHLGGMPIINTGLLLISGVTLTWAHSEIISGRRLNFFKGTVWTLALSGLFMTFQYLEYKYSSIHINDSVFGSIFFMVTGFHGFHVLIGTVFIFVSFLRTLNSENTTITRQQHFGFIAGLWYWHFVDIIWLFVFFVFYILPSNQITFFFGVP
jgi:heme/copper-type cytochrome/quinol oxidase subunit 3